jgi:hypothetical protein
MRPRTLLILLALVAGLGAFIWFYERDLPSSEERAAQAKKILAVEKDDVQAVTLESGGAVVALERVPGKDEKDGKAAKDGEAEGEKGEEAAPVSVEWRMTRPLQARADTFAVDGLLDALANLEKTRTLEDIDPVQVGLDKPQAVVRLRTKQGEKVLQIGAPVPTGGAVIARIAGEKEAHVVSDSILTEIRREPGTWRDRRLFQADRAAVGAVRLVSGGSDTTLSQKGPGFQVAGDPADRERVEELFADLDSLSAETFLDPSGRAPAELGLAPPQAVIQVAMKGRPAMRIEIGGVVEGATPPTAESGEAAQADLRYARVDGQLVETRTRLLELATRPAAEWRSPLLSALEVHQVDSVTVNEPQGGPALTLTRAGTDWKRGDQMISYVPVSDLLFALTGARADRLLAPSEAQPAQAVLTFTLQGKAGAETLTLYPETPGGSAARASDRGTVLLLPPGKLREIRERLAAVRKAEPLKAEATAQ